MNKEGKYIYCIIETKQERNFGPVIMGGKDNEVQTIGYDDLSMVVSTHSIEKLTVDEENLLAHEKVIEKVMKEFDSVLPVRFGSIAASSDEVRNLLDRRHREFKSLLRDMDHKVELGVKGMWKDMDIIFEEIVKENEGIRKAKKDIEKGERKKNIRAKTEIGKMVEQSLMKKKEREAEKILDALRRTAVEYKLNKTFGDEMFMNAAFLVTKGREKEFDNIMDDLSDEYNNRIKFKYTGPLPVFNFATTTIYPEEWEI